MFCTLKLYIENLIFQTCFFFNSILPGGRRKMPPFSGTGYYSLTASPTVLTLLGFFWMLKTKFWGKFWHKFLPQTASKGGSKKMKILKIGHRALLNMICRTHKKRNKSKICISKIERVMAISVSQGKTRSQKLKFFKSRYLAEFLR